MHVFINLEGREPDGIVSPDDYTDTQLEIIAALHAYTDPATGRHPFALAITREDAEMVNLWGDTTGDVVYALRPEFDGAHGKQLPSVSFGIAGQHCTFVLAGPGVKEGLALQGQVRVVDVAPTLMLSCWGCPCRATSKAGSYTRRSPIPTGTSRSEAT